VTTTEPAVDRSETRSSTHAGESLLKRLASLQSVWILGVLLVIVVFFTIAGGSKFLSASNFSLISQNIAVWAVLGVGMTFVIITSGIDLSIGSVLVFSSVVAAKVMEAIGGDGWGTALSASSPRSSPAWPGASSTASWSPRPRSRR
jgi:ribose transport system permease protein